MQNSKIILFPLFPKMTIYMFLDLVLLLAWKIIVGDHLFLGNMSKSFIRDPLRMKNMVTVDPEVGPFGSLNKFKSSDKEKYSPN